MITATYETPNGVSGEVRGEPLEMAQFFSALGTSPTVRAKRGRPPGPVKKAGKRGGRSKHDDAQKQQIVAEAEQLGRGGMPAFLKAKGISYGTLVNWRAKLNGKSAK